VHIKLKIKGDGMPYTTEMIDELNVLNLYDLANHQEGIKVHTTAEGSAIAAAQRLHNKGLITQEDGGYLTALGLDAAENAQALFTILTTQ